MLKKQKYEFLIRQYKDRIYSYSMLVLRNRMDAEDVTQEVFIRIWNNFGKFKLTSAKSWIMKTTHNLCIDYLRKRKLETQRNTFLDEEESSYAFNRDGEISPEKGTHLSLLKVKVENEIKNLPENLKNVFILYQSHGLKYKEISQVLNIPVNSVKVYLLRARLKLQEALNEY